MRGGGGGRGVCVCVCVCVCVRVCVCERERESVINARPKCAKNLRKAILYHIHTVIIRDLSNLHH